MTMEILLLSKTPVKPSFSNSRMATGEVMSLPKTISSLARMSWPAVTSGRPAWAARIFCVIVIPIEIHSSCIFPFAGNHCPLAPVCPAAGAVGINCLARFSRLTAVTRAYTDAMVMSLSTPTPQ